MTTGLSPERSALRGHPPTYPNITKENLLWI
jgi:hypothetical protein